jgi:WD40 repeat protein
MFVLDHRLLLVGVAVCLGTPAVSAQPKDDAAKARLATKLDGPDGIDCIDEVAFTPDRKMVALFQSDLRIRLWDTATGKWLGTLGGHRFESADLFALVGAGKTVLAWNGTGTGACLAWDTKTGDVRTVFSKVGRNGRDARWAAGASADGKWIATVHSGDTCPSRVRGWDVSTGKELWEFNNADGKQMIFAVAFSPAGQALALGTGDGKVKLLDPKTGKEAAVLDDGTDEACAVEWSADGKRLAAVQRGPGNRARAVVWEVPPAKPEGGVARAKVAGTVGPFDRTPGHWALAPDGKHLAALGADGALAVWTVPGEKPVVSVKVWGQRGLVWSADGKALLVVREYPRVLELLTFDLADILPKK